MHPRHEARRQSAASTGRPPVVNVRPRTGSNPRRPMARRDSRQTKAVIVQPLPEVRSGVR